MLVPKMFANGGRRVFMFLDALIYVPASKNNITCIAQVTFKFVNKTFLAHNRGLIRRSDFLPLDVKKKTYIICCQSIKTIVLSKAHAGDISSCIHVIRSDALLLLLAVKRG